jgi:hypothetical protein
VPELSPYSGQPPEVKVEKEEGKPGKEGVEEGAAPADEESGNAVMKVLNKAKKHMIYSLTVDVHEVSEVHSTHTGVQALPEHMLTKDVHEVRCTTQNSASTA